MKTPHDRKAILMNDENKTQLIMFILVERKSDVYADILNRCVNYVNRLENYQLSRKSDGMTVYAGSEMDLFYFQKEADTRTVFHCINISKIMTENTSIVVRSS